LTVEVFNKDDVLDGALLQLPLPILVVVVVVHVCGHSVDVTAGGT